MKHSNLFLLLLCFSTGVSSYPYSEAQVYYAGSSAFIDVRTGEFHGDGIKDLFILIDRDPLSMGILTGIGNGEFAPFTPLDIDCSGYGCNIINSRNLLIMDYPPHDGLDDIVVVYEDNEFTVHKNNGDGSWTCETVPSPETWPLYRLIGSCDCDLDGEADIISFGLTNIMHLCTIPTSSNAIIVPLPDLSYTYPLADFNGDGYIDVTVSHNASASLLTTLWGYPDCLFFDPVILPFGGQMWGDMKGVAGFKVGDFNDDGYDDIVYMCRDDQWYCYIGIYFGSDAGLVYDGKYYWTPDCMTGLFVTDADCDGYDDIGIVDTRFWDTDNELPLYIHYSEPDTLGARCDTMVLPAEWGSGVRVADLNGDNYDDLYYFPTDDSIGVLINLGPVSTLLASSSIEYRDGGKVHIDWKLSCESCGLSEFQILRKRGSSESELITVLDYIKGNNCYSYVDDVSRFPGELIAYYVYAKNVDGIRTALTEGNVVIPQAEMRLFPNYPNPFNPGTTITFEVSDPGRVWLDIFDVSGRLVTELINGLEYPSGRYEMVWNGTDMRGSPLASGVYYCRLRINKDTLKQKMLIVR